MIGAAGSRRISGQISGKIRCKNCHLLVVNLAVNLQVNFITQISGLIDVKFGTPRQAK
jgi:hypothetical protein